MHPLPSIKPAKLAVPAPSSNPQKDRLHPSFSQGIARVWRHTTRFLSCGKLYNVPLTKRDLRIIEKFKHTQLYKFPHKLEVVACSNKEAPSHFNESLEGMRDFSRQLAQLAMECIHEQYIASPVKWVNEKSEEVPRIVSDLAQQAIKIGSLSVKPIFELIQKFEVNQKAIEQIDKLLGWAVQDVQPLDFKERKEFHLAFEAELLNKMDSKVDFVLPPASESLPQKNIKEHLEVCSAKIVDWLFESNHTQSLLSLFNDEPYKPSEEMINYVFQQALHLLVEKKIIFYKNKANHILQNRLPLIVEASLKENARNITDLVSGRLAEILDNMGDEQFTVLFDKIVEVISNHLTNVADSYEEAEKAASEHAKLEKYAQRVITCKPETQKEIRDYNLCKKYLQKLHEMGGVPAIEEDVLFKTFLALNGSKEFVIENNTTEEISKLFLNTLLPDVIENGKHVKGLENLLSTIKLPEEFTELFNEAKEIAQMVLTPEQYTELVDLGKTASDFKELALDGCSELIKIGFNEALELLIKQTSNPEELNLVMTSSILPATVDMMVQSFADDLIYHNLNKLAPYFYKLPHAAVEKKLLQLLFQLANEEGKLYGFSKEKEEAFFNIVKIRLDEIVKLIQKVKKRDPKKDGIRSVVAIIKAYYKEENAKGNNPHFANFIDVGLRVGQFGNFLPRLFNLKTIRNMSSKLITSSLHNLRQSYRPGLNRLIPLMEEKYLDREVMKKLIKQYPSLEELELDIQAIEERIKQVEEKVGFNSNDDRLLNQLLSMKKLLQHNLKLKEEILAEDNKHQKEVIQAQKNLSVEVDKVARLGYDMMLYKAKKKMPLIGKFIFRYLVGNTADKIGQTALRVIAKTIGRQSFNEHLLNKILLTSLSAIHMTTALNREVKPLLHPNNQLKIDHITVPVTAQSRQTPPLKIEIPLTGERLSTWGKIRRFIVGIFARLFNLFRTKKISLSGKQIKLMEYINKDKEATPAPALTVPSTPSVEAVSAIQEIKIVENEPETGQLNYNFFFKEDIHDLNPSLQKVGKFVDDFMSRISQEIFQEKIRPLTHTVERNAQNLPQSIPQVLDWITKIISPWVNTILKKVIKHGYKFELDTSTKSFFNILLKELKDKDGALKEGVFDKMEAYVRKMNLVTTNDDLQLYLEPIRQWASQKYNHSEEIHSLAEYTGPRDVKYDIMVSKFYVAAVQWLIRYKLESHIDEFQYFLENKLSGMVERHLTNNMQRLSSLLFNRIATLINLITDEDYKNLFDNSAQMINNQLVNLIKAEKIVGGSLSLVKGKENEAVWRKHIARELIAKDTTGEPRYNLPALARALIDIPSHIKKEDIEGYKAVEENKFFLPLVEKLLNYALPTGHQELVEGKVIVLDAFEELLDNIIIEPEIQNMGKELHQFLKSLLPPKFASKIDTINTTVVKISKKFILNVVRQNATKVLAQQLKGIFTILSEEKKRMEFLAETFSLIHKEIIRSFVSYTMTINEQHSTYFFAMMLESHLQPRLKGRLVEELWESCSNRLKCSWKALKISEVDFLENHLPNILIDFTLAFLAKYHIGDISHSQLRLLIEDPTSGAAVKRIAEILLQKIYEKHPEMELDPASHEYFLIYLNPLLEKIVTELREKQKVLRKISPDATLEAVDIDTTLNNFFIGANDKQTVYVDMIANIIKMGKLGGDPTASKITFLETFIQHITQTSRVRNALTAVLVPAMHPVRASILGITDLMAQALNKNYLNDQFIKNLLNPETLNTLKVKKQQLKRQIEDKRNLLKAAEDNHKAEQHNKKIIRLKEELEEIRRAVKFKKMGTSAEKIKENEAKMEGKFQQGLSLTATILYDLINFFVNENQSFWANQLGKWGLWMASVDEIHLQEVLRTFYDKFFHNDDLNEGLFLEIMQMLLKRIEEKSALALER
ncbi:Uncharacterized protein NEOC65_001737 [Neochlamydia sp. AcF65]|uniref:hypothetical protein n=1 Tax=Neochlamydia sp. AcF65 TaxID=2795735 RepID=UPI001BCA4740|nr:hypothetical protein [Neochlamydia sp. AcF65]MBS4166645.1 Uncharacterized protein [Neochlamydia sp. AcF65]